jgi:uncharacterized alkaline shock family protein YloU
MNLVNRLLVIVGLLIAVALTPIAIVLVLFFRPGVAAWLNNLARGLTDGPNVLFVQVICVGVALFVFIVALILLFLEFSRPSARRLRVQQVTDGIVQVTDEALIQRLEHDIAQIADVVSVRMRAAAGKGDLVNLTVELETSPEVNVPAKSQQVIAAAKQVMEQQMGLQVGKIQVQLNPVRKPVKPQGS